MIIDSPPLFNVSDAHLISKVVEQTILVVRSGNSTYDSVARAQNILTNINSSLLGLIVNAVDIKKKTTIMPGIMAHTGITKMTKRHRDDPVNALAND